jgi:hypothetical protein
MYKVRKVVCLWLKTEESLEGVPFENEAIQMHALSKGFWVKQ